MQSDRLFFEAMFQPVFSSVPDDKFAFHRYNNHIGRKEPEYICGIEPYGGMAEVLSEIEE